MTADAVEDCGMEYSEINLSTLDPIPIYERINVLISKNIAQYFPYNLSFSTQSLIAKKARYARKDRQLNSQQDLFRYMIQLVQMNVFAPNFGRSLRNFTFRQIRAVSSNEWYMYNKVARDTDASRRNKVIRAKPIIDEPNLILD